jgi:MHS family proline/betaine transporter-like MFS transporter
MFSDQQPAPQAVPTLPNGGFSRRRAIIAAGLGNCLELFDLTVFGFFAATIGTAFFPNSDPVTSILGSFATFALGFLMRPVGALCLASIGDKRGRKSLLTLTMTLMGLSSLGIALLPTYGEIGLTASVLLVVFRLIQGFAAGGEWGGAVTMMVEQAPPNRRGFVGSFQQLGFGIGILAGTICAVIVNGLLDEPARLAFGWRLPFAIGALVAPIAFYIRRSVDESPAFKELLMTGHRVRSPVAAAFSSHWPRILAVVGIGTMGTAAGYISNQFMSTFAVKSLGLPVGRVSTVIMIASLLQMFLIPFWGWISDRIGALVVMGAAALIYTLLIYPMFSVLVHAPGLMPLLTVVCVSAVLTAASFGPLPALLCSLFPPEVRTTAISIGYNFAAAIFGGLAPFISTWLVRVTGDLVAPTYYAILCGTISVVAIPLYAFSLKQIRFREVGPSHV